MIDPQSVLLSQTGFWPTFRRTLHWYVLALIVLVNLAFRIHLARECSLWIDEMLAYWFARDSTWSTIFTHGATLNHPGFPHLMTKITLLFLEPSEMNLRLYSILFGSIAIPVFYILCRRLKFSATPALLITLSISFSRFYIRHATQSVQYSAYLLWILVMVLVLQKIYEQPDRKMLWGVFSFLSLLSCFTHYFAVGYVVLLWMVLLILILVRFHKKDSKARKTLHLYLIFGCIFLVLFMVWIGPAFLKMSKEGENRPSLKELHYSYPFLKKCLGHFVWTGFPRQGYPIYAQLSMTLLGIVLLLFRYKNLESIAFSLIIIFVFPLLVVGFMVTGHFIDPRYIIPSYAAYTIISAYPIVFVYEWVCNRKGQYSQIKKNLAGVGLCVVFLSPLVYYFSGYPQSFQWIVGLNDYRAFSEYVDKELPKDTRVIIIQDQGWPNRGRQIFNEYYKINREVYSLYEYDANKAIGKFLFIELRLKEEDEKKRYQAFLNHFGLEKKQYDNAPYLPVPSGKYQPPVKAKLIDLSGGRIQIQCMDATTKQLMCKVLFQTYWGQRKINEDYDRDGIWTHDLSPGVYQIRALPQDTRYAPNVKTISVSSKDCILETWSFHFFEDAPLEPGRAALRLKLVQLTGEVWHKVFVSVLNQDTVVYSDWSREGYFQLWNFPPGTYQFLLESKESAYLRKEVSFILESDQKKDIEITLEH